MSKYRPLTEFLKGESSESVRLSFEEIARLIGGPLPRSAYRHRRWWSNSPRGHSHARAWLSAGWRSERVDMEDRTVLFRRWQGGQPWPGEDYDPWGAMRGSVTVQPGWDLTQPTGEEWNAEPGEH